ncbi:MAG: hypothetical protein ACP6IP_08505 [Candidatus Njordarchaeia archaeon]
MKIHFHALKGLLLALTIILSIAPNYTSSQTKIIYLSALNAGMITGGISVKDYYPEIRDGVRKFIFAVFEQTNYEPPYDQLPGIHEKINELRDVLKSRVEEYNRIHSEKWVWEEYIFDISPAHITDFVSFFEKLDEVSDGDDRIFLIIMGHGGMNGNQYYKKMRGESHRIYSVDESAQI